MLATLHFATLCTAEYLPQTITATPGYTLLAGVSHIPAPIAVAAEEQGWAGIDGTWNTFSIQIGSQGQNVSVLVSTTSPQVSVMNAQACTTVVLSSLPDSVSQMSLGQCGSSRGFLFNTSQSSTWFQIGYYDLQAPITSNVDAIGLFGLERVGFGLPNGEEGPTLSNTTVGTIGTYSSLATPEFWLGRIGLQSRQNVFPSQPSRPSYITGLFDMQVIPSKSFGYTAGAKYREGGNTPYQGNLVLGGYDASRIVSNNVVFEADTGHNLVVRLATLTAQTTSASDIDLLNGTNIDLHIDSNVAEIWLPVNICKAFEEAFGLTYNEATELYLVDDILHQRLLGLNPSITFTLCQAAGETAAGTVEVTLPYGAFDLGASPPYQNINDTSRYFPLRRGVNETQWTLGRTFLQEAYLTVDWERSQFHIYPCDWTRKNTSLIAMVSPRYGNAIDVSDDTSSRSSTSVTVGIAVGVTAVVLLLVAVAWWMWRRRSQRDTIANNSLLAVTDLEGKSAAGHLGEAPIVSGGQGHLVFPKAELPGESNIGRNRNPFTDAMATQQPIYEMMGDFPSTEAGGRQLSEKESMIFRERNVNGVESNGATAPRLAQTTSRLVPISSMDEVTIMSRISGHHRLSTSSGVAGHEGATDPPPYQTQPVVNKLQDYTRRRFSYES